MEAEEENNGGNDKVEADSVARFDFTGHIRKRDWGKGRRMISGAQ